MTELAEHWDRAYREGEATRSWFEATPAESLRMLDRAGVTPDDSVIDVGGGASHLVDALLERGHRDLTVLDVSAEGMACAKRRIDSGEKRLGRVRVEWLIEDIRAWHPSRQWSVWHDRAVLHFMVETADRAGYLAALCAAIPSGGVAVFGCFAPDGPERCSGLPVARYDPDGLGRLLGDGWTRIGEDREQHLTPVGVVQPFTWASFLRSSRDRIKA
ncbi:MAG TPA: class I SAM-dependent methyltransferase [Acidimicrobiales bacterium]|nr:class I SAM-dependent methyltransferase [Acidimicrobiales bacterium]